MAEASDTKQLLYQNLKDAGCNPEILQQCMALALDRNISELLNLLAKHRKHLLDQVHIHHKEIDCLDYLIYSLKNNDEWRK